jgi:hypothetical protein
MSFTDSLPLIDADESRRSDATEMPLSVTHASLGPSDSRRHWPWLVAVCAVAAAVVGAARLHDEHVPPPVLARGLASPDLGFAVQTASVPPTRPVQEAAPTDTPLTPSDLELAAPEIAPSNLGRVQNAVSHRALDAPRAFAMKPKVVKSSPQPKAPEPAAPEAALPVIDRAALYRRD